MKTTKISAIFIAFGLTVCLAHVSGAAPVGTAFAYQGYLYDADYPADGLYDFWFRLYDDPDAGSQQANTIKVDELDIIDGQFTVQLDFGGAVFAGQALWLQVAVRAGELEDPNEYDILSPRQEITPAPYAIYAQNAGLASIDGVTNPGGDVDIIAADALTITPSNITKTITIGENHSAGTDNPHQVTAEQTGALVSVEGVANPGGNINLVPQGGVTITANTAAKTITIGESHSIRTDNPHIVTAAQIGAMVSVDGVSNPGGNVDFVAGGGMNIATDATAKTITFSSGATIKQVVRGVITFDAGQHELSGSLSPSIDPGKSVVFLSPVVNSQFVVSDKAGAMRNGACLVSLTASQITISIDSMVGSTQQPQRRVSYQIIEYN